ncbi:hypothetical protein TYRP_022695, partial [Tyrophagus putrescentiae]
KANSKGNKVNSYSEFLFKRLTHTPLAAPSTAVAVLATCTSSNVMLYLEDVLTQWLGLCRMNNEPNVSWLLLQEKFQLLDFYSESTVNVIVSHLLANFLAYNIYDDGAQRNEHVLLPVEWSRYAFVYGQHSLQTSVSESHLASASSDKKLNVNNHHNTTNWIPCLHRYHNLAFDSENDQITFVPFNCLVSEQQIIITLLKCSTYKKLLAKIATDNGVRFDEVINKIFTKGNHMNNFKSNIDKLYLKKTKNLSVLREKHLVAYEKAYAKYRDALAYFDHFVITYIFQHNCKLNQKFFPPA